MNRQYLAIGVAAALLLVVLGIVYPLLRSGDTLDGVAPITGAERAEEARGVIAEIERRRATAETAAPAPAPTAPANPEPAEEQLRVAAAEPTEERSELDDAFDRAQAFREAGQLADAQLLYFFAARGGHAASAFELGTMNDPNHHSPSISLLPEPDAFQAYRWYSVASEQGMTAATERLEALREWALAASQAGDTEAEQLLLQWE